MRRDFVWSIVTALCLTAVLAVSTTSAFAQGQPEPAGVNPAGGGVPMRSLERLKAKAAGPTPRTADGKPDLSGLWGPEPKFMGDISNALKPGEKLPLQPWAVKLTRERLSKDDPNASCMPSGIPRQAPFPFKVVQTSKLIIFLIEGNVHTYRQIFVDGSGHPKDLDPSWFGDSRGTWQGDTLVIDTVGFNDKFWFDGIGHPHTEKLHVIERYRRPDAAHLGYEVTIDDPGAYTRPFTMYGQSPLLQNTEIMEYFCIENNQDVAHILGKGTPAKE